MEITAFSFQEVKCLQDYSVCGLVVYSCAIYLLQIKKKGIGLGAGPGTKILPALWCGQRQTSKQKFQNKYMFPHKY